MPNNASEDIDPFLSIAKIAAIMSVSSRTVRRWIERGELEAVRLPGTGPAGPGERPRNSHGPCASAWASLPRNVSRSSFGR